MRLPPPKVLLPPLVLGGSIVVAVLMVAARPSVAPQVAVAPPPFVRVVEVAPEEVRLTVRTQGTVVPRTESALVPEVAGRIVWVSPTLVAGGFFEAGDPLVRLERVDHEVRVTRARATVDARRSASALAARTRDRNRALAAEGLISAHALEDAENAARLAAAALEEAEAELVQAERDLVRTELRAPFAGRVREKHVDVGQFVARGTAVARLYAVDYAEVRLPVPDRDVAFLDLSLGRRGQVAPAAQPAVVLRARFAGRSHTWRGRVVRTEGEIDPLSRMVHVVARVEDPYGRGGDTRPPLAVGMFVEAEIEGRIVPEAVLLPRAALRAPGEVLVVDDRDRLRRRAVEVLRVDGDRVVVRAGLAAGERVCVSPLETATDGMAVRTVTEAS